MMDGSANSLGGNSTNNQNLVAPPNSLQSTGNQSLTPAQDNLQQQTSNVLNDQNLRLTDTSGQLLNLEATKTTTVVAKQPSSKHHNLTVYGASIMIIVTVFAITWFFTRKTSKN